MSTQKKTTAVLMCALACCLLSGCQPTTVTDCFVPGLTEPDLIEPDFLTLDEWEDLEAEYGPSENWVDGLGPERPEDFRDPVQVHLTGFQREPAKAFWVDPVWWAESVFKPLGIDFLPKTEFGPTDCSSSCGPDGVCG
ncbi:MAG: hypothetical protein OSA98_15695 [Rubripirellula sp.]|nr:hypothetical protein [Rubripirellula sp.]